MFHALSFELNLFFDQSFPLTGGSSYLPLPDQIAYKRAVINPKNESDEEFFKWAVIEALYHEEIKSHRERISNLVKFEDNYNWGGLEFPLPIKGIHEFERRNDVSINMLGVEGMKVYILRRNKYEFRKKMVNLLLIDDGKWRHYTAIKSLSRLLPSSNSKDKHKQYFV